LSIAAQPPAIPIRELTMRFKIVAAAAFVAIMLLGANRASAAYTAYSNDADITGLQIYGGALGLDFQVNSAITITALGAFNNGVTANLDGKNGSGIDVGIFSLSGTPAGTTVHFDSTSIVTQINGDAFLPVSFTLNPGTYSIVATDDRNYNSSGAANNFNTTDDGGGLISFIGKARYTAGTTLALPGTIDGGPVDRYAAGTFQFTAADGTHVSVPEPASALLLAAGLGAMALLLRRRA
jgi:hypothetical protein